MEILQAAFTKHNKIIDRNYPFYKRPSISVQHSKKKPPKLGLGLMEWSLLPDAMQPFKIYCASPSITSQLVLFLWWTVEIDTLGHVRVVEALQNFVKKSDPVILSGIRIHIAGVHQFRCRWDTFCIKDLCPFQFCSYLAVY